MTDSSSNQDNSTHFGFKRVAKAEKAMMVGQVFDTVASHYDLMNDAMSFGMHRLWKRMAVNHLSVRPHHRILDLAAGSGDMTARIKEDCPAAKVVMADINAAMLQRARDRMLDQGCTQGVDSVQANGEQLPFAEDTFDRCICAFGIRNMTDIPLVLKECLRVLKPAGFLLVLECSHVEVPWMQAGYDAYSFHVIPKMGRFLANEEASYRYFVESIRKHPDRAAFRDMCLQAGFAKVDDWPIMGGVVALHKAVKG